jgi:glycine/D-amino acid oxidase-like deaminating enzyme
MTEDYRNLSFWLDSVPDSLEPRSSLSIDIDADVAIIGAGYTGLWTAYYLKKIDPALKIVIVESEIAGFGASGRNGGWCSAYLAGISKWLDDPATRDGAIRLQRLLFDTVKEVSKLTERESINCHFEQSGALEIAVNAMQEKRLREEFEYSRKLGFGDEDYRWLDASEIGETLAMEGAQAAIHMAHTAAVHPARLARGLAATLESMGVSIYERSTVTGIAPRYLSTGSGSVKAGSIMIATEGYSNDVTRQKNQLIPLHSMMVATEPLSAAQLDELKLQQRFCFGSVHHLVTYGQLTADKRIAFGCRGSYNYGSGISQFSATDPGFNTVRETLLQLFPSLNGVNFTHAWGGAMGVARNLFPSVNFDRATGLGWAGAYFGNGVGATNLAGRTMADLITGRDTDRTHTPWVNPDGADKHWEPEPLRWLAIKSAKGLMQVADKCEENNSRFTPVVSKALDKIWS